MKHLTFIIFPLLIGCGGGGSEDSFVKELIPISSETTIKAAYCGYELSGNVFTDVVLSVHDGDTVTLGSGKKVRLDSIDAPEITQEFGQESKNYLSKLVLNQKVNIVSSKIDQYGRILGSVFTSSCDFVNLQQVKNGMAWFYKAYQCEIPTNTRNEYLLAQDYSISQHYGLWSSVNPVAPWIYRNGTNPIAPMC